MHFNLGGIVKGITTGLETLVETGNPYVAAGAGAIACFSGSGNGGNPGSPASPVPTFNPLLDSMSAENPFERQNVNALSSFAQRQSDLGSIIDPELTAA